MANDRSLPAHDRDFEPYGFGQDLLVTAVTGKG